MKTFKTRLLMGSLLMLLLTGCGKTISDNIPMASQDLFAMDTHMTLTGYGEKCEEAIEAAVLEIERLEALFSVGKETSEVSKVNKDGTIVM